MILIPAVVIGGSVFAYFTWIYSPPKIGVLNINGPITWKHATLAEKAEGDPAIDAVVLRINSPGGTVSASFQAESSISELADEKTVVADLEQYAASGAYLASSASDHIYAHSQTTTGGLGVRAIWVSYEDYFENLGIDYHVWKSGERKDMFAPYRSPTENENVEIRSLVESYTNELFSRIGTNRSGTTGLDNLRDGSVIDGDEALNYGLVDELGSFQDAVDKAADMENLETYESISLSKYYGIEN